MSNTLRKSEKSLLNKLGTVISLARSDAKRQKDFSLAGNISFVNDPGAAVTGYLFKVVDDKLVRIGFITDMMGIEHNATEEHIRAIVRLAGLCGIQDVQMVTIGRLHAAAHGKIVTPR